MSSYDSNSIFSSPFSRLVLVIVFALGMAPAASAVGPTISYVSANPTLSEGSSIPLGIDAVITDPDSATLSKIDIICCGDGFPLTFAADPATMGSIRLRWTGYIYISSYLYQLSPDSGPLPTMNHWQNALRALRVGASGGVTTPDGGVSVWLLPYDDGNTLGQGARNIRLLPTVLSVPPGTIATSVDQALTFTGANSISFPDLGDFSSPDYADRQRLSVSVTHGTLTVVNTAGVSFIEPNGSAALEFEGSSSGVRAALDGLIYTSVAGYEGGDLLVVTLSGRFVHPQGQTSVVEIDRKEIPLRVGTTPVTLQSFDID